ncbi:hypothetical protein FPZ12_011885 [Amycolatopsis acidicola]|uniref:LPXTG cell wall anchor domain-containing protein n=1 Tax=Amycolatopsis acidicola TaxID=2596893 RepID=A0A5N0V9N1_9PSEU|nr:hypothetical protein [Amycolatopsis acidicola]KAA9162334.1 hypothetical protein FPZ12_011885 [Amycolatopsis acidicola]
MSKIITRVAGFVAVFMLLFAGVAEAATAPSSAVTPSAAAGGATAKTPETDAASSTGETRAVVVGGLAFVLMVGAAGAVLWHTARTRKSTD